MSRTWEASTAPSLGEAGIPGTLWLGIYIYIGIVGIIPYILYTVKKIHCTDTLYICIYYGDISNVYTCLYSITCIYVYSIYVRFIDVWSMTDI